MLPIPGVFPTFWHRLQVPCDSLYDECSNLTNKLAVDYRRSILQVILCYLNKVFMMTG